MQDRFKFRTYIPDLRFFKYWGWIQDNHYVGLCACGDYQMPELLEKYTNQCTGRKDKNGKLIYEGDIFDKGTYCKWIVTWFKNRFILVPDFEYKNKDKCANDRKCGFKYFENNYSYADREDEVIGNIYENPELLED